MDVIGLAIALVVIIAVAAIVVWFTRSSGIGIPQPFVIVIYAVLAIVAILVVARFAGLGRAW